MANELHGINACVYINGVELQVASAWSLSLVGEECEIVRFGDTWKELLRGVLASSGSITAYHDQDAKILADAAQEGYDGSETGVLLYPDCTDDSTYYEFDAWFDFEHTADPGSCQAQTAPFRVDGDVAKVGFECMLLKDSFSVAEGPPMGAARTCFPGPGQLIPDQTDGNFTVAGGVLSFPAQGTPLWGDQDFYALDDAGNSYARAAGRLLKFRLRVTTDGHVWVGWGDDTAPLDEVSGEHIAYIDAVSTGLWCPSGAIDDFALYDIWPALNGWGQVAIVLSPYNSAGVHYFPGTGNPGTHGAHFFFRDETATYPHAVLAWFRETELDATLYPTYSGFTAAGEIDYVVMPCGSFEDSLLTPCALDHFTGSGALAAHTMDYGGWTWTEHVGSWTVGTGVVSPNAVVDAVATYATRSPDVWHRAEVYIPAASAAPIGLVVRKSADTAGGENEWRLTIQGNTLANDTLIDEVLDGAVTNRAAADDDWTDDTTYSMRVRADDEELTLYVDKAAGILLMEVHYASAWFNKFATWHGIYSDNDAGATFENVMTLYRGSGLDRLCYDDFTHINGTELSDTTTEEGAKAWVEDEGDWEIQTNEADPDDSDPSRCHVETDVADVWVEARALVPAADEWGGVCVRGSADTMGGGNFWYFAIGDRAGNDEELGDCQDGSYTQRAAANTGNYPNGARYYIQVRCKGRDIRGWVDGADELGFATAIFNETATRHGLYNDDHTDARYDQFRVTAMPDVGEYDGTLNDIS